jgi:hypothetical protein
MKNILLLILMTSPCALAQNAVTINHYQTSGPDGVMAWGGMAIAAGPRVQGAPYSATITNKFTQTLADGSLIVQTNTGSSARDSAGRTREDAPVPTVDDPSAHPPQLVFLHDPVAHTSYVLDLTNKTAHKTPLPPSTEGNRSSVVQSRVAFSEEDVGIAPDEASEGPVMVTTRDLSPNQNVHSEDLGSQTMEGLLVNGVRMTHTIPAGEIGNAMPIEVVSEVWTSPELKTVIYSKLSDPRAGEHIFQLTDIVRAEPAPSLFVVPANFQIVDRSEYICFGPNP